MGYLKEGSQQIEGIGYSGLVNSLEGGRQKKAVSSRIKI